MAAFVIVIYVTVNLVANFKNTFDLNRHLHWQRIHADGTSSPNASFFAEHVAKQLAATIDHRRMLIKIIGTPYHTE